MTNSGPQCFCFIYKSSLLSQYNKENVTPLTGMIVRKHSSPDVHGVCSFAYQNAVLGYQFSDVMKDCVIIHGQGFL